MPVTLHTKLTKNAVFHIKPFLGGMKTDNPPSAVSHTHTGSFSSLLLTFSSWRLLGRQETQLLSAWTQPRVVLKPKPRRV